MSDLQKDNFHQFTPEEIDQLPGREVKEKRTLSSKTYALGNGLYQAVVYPEAVHFRNEKGEWEDIDHSLNTEDDCCCDHSGDLTVQLSAGGKATLRKNNHALSWQIVGAAAVEPKAENVEPHYHRHNKKQRIENLVIFADLFPDVDFACELKPNQFKDTLIFKNANALRPVEFLLHTEDLVLQQNESGEVVAMCGDDIIFRLPAPCVVNEDKEAIANSAHATLTRIGDSDWHWACEVDAEYAETATYPIHLDPVVKTDQTASAMSMAYTSSKNPTTNYSDIGSTTKIANNDSSLGKVCTFLRFESLPEIDASYYVTAATLRMTTNSTMSSSTALYIKEVTGSWAPGSLTYSNQPTVAAEPLEYSMVPTSNATTMAFNIANLVRKWYNGENNGIMLETTSGNLVKLASATSTYYKPYITINYVSLAGMENYLVQDSISCGRAGTAYVGLFNGNVAFTHQETSMNGNLLPISISRFYNSCYRNVNPFGAGMGWKLSPQKSLHKETIDSTTYYVYMDDDGTRHHFKKTSGEWKDLSGMQLTLTLGTNSATITDKGDNKMVFALPTIEFANNYANVGMVNHKCEVVSYKTKERRRVPKEEQIVVENTHEAIIDADMFARVQEILGSRAHVHRHEFDNSYNIDCEREYFYDDETGLHYLRNRYYTPLLGRFLNKDFILGTIGEILAHSQFSYCKNNFINLTDEDGNSPQSPHFMVSCMNSEGGMPIALDHRSITPPSTLNLMRDFGQPIDVTMPLISSKTISTKIDDKTAKNITDGIALSRGIETVYYAATSTFLSIFAPNPYWGAAWWIGSNGYSVYSTYSADSNYVSPTNYYTTVALYDARGIDEDLVYVLVRTDSASDSALNTTWWAAGYYTDELDTQQIVNEALWITN